MERVVRSSLFQTALERICFETQILIPGIYEQPFNAQLICLFCTGGSETNVLFYAAKEIVSLLQGARLSEAITFAFRCVSEADRS
ncbi:hypothetical protein NPIL_530211 [Nephila pilipes]|uniref:Uncharacterized protein n=1 Tax=Nephila pilipes TaxID=299642 RepID=A0A8X6T4J7_NEPPI|nr:hypothetical protein NPIL_530211 [Nephila pilipes]